jgi:hypothetical protein
MTSAASRFAHCVAVCASIHDVTAAERALRMAGLWCDMVPTPRSLSSNCGMVLEFHGRDLARVKTVFGSLQVRCTGIYTCVDTEYVREPWNNEEPSH